MNTDDLPVLNLPCKLYRGLGLYSVVARSQPSDSDLSCELTQPCMFHIGDSASTLKIDGTNNQDSNTSVFSSQGCPTGGASFLPPRECLTSNCYLYFKILDRFYGTGEDNYGSYTVEFKQGVQSSNVRLITRFVSVVNALMCDIAEKMYEGLVKGGFVAYVRVMLVLTIAFLGASVLTGFSSLTHKEMLILVLKIGIVLQLISPTSWEFFNTTLFKFFTHGIGQITGIIFGAGNVSPVPVDLPDGIPASEECKRQTLAGFTAFDDVLAQLFSRATTMKVLSLLVYRGEGILYVPIIYICLVVVLFILLKSLLVYLVSILVISVVISLAPLFISFILFEKTKYIFDNWLKTLISYFIQPIIIMTFAFFVLQIFVAQMHSLLGVRVCWKEWANLGFFKLYAWKAEIDPSNKQCILTPGPILKYCDPKTQTCKGGAIGSEEPSKDPLKPGQAFNMVGDLSLAKYPFLGAGSCSPGDANIVHPVDGDSCMPYTCTQERYIDFPYLDPNFPTDESRVEELRKGKVISIKDMVIWILIIWFMYEFNKLVPNIAKQIASGEVAGGVNLSETGASFGGSLFNYMVKKPARLTGALASKLGYATGIAGTARAIRFGIVGFKEAAQDKIYGKFIKPREEQIQRLKNKVNEKIDAFAKANPKTVSVLKVGGRVALGLLKPHKAVGDITSKIGENWQAKKETVLKGAEKRFEKAKGTVTRKLGIGGPQAELGEKVEPRAKTPAAGAPHLTPDKPEAPAPAAAAEDANPPPAQAPEGPPAPAEPAPQAADAELPDARAPHSMPPVPEGSGHSSAAAVSPSPVSHPPHPEAADQEVVRRAGVPDAGAAHPMPDEPEDSGRSPAEAVSPAAEADAATARTSSGSPPHHSEEPDKEVVRRAGMPDEGASHSMPDEPAASDHSPAEAVPVSNPPHVDEASAPHPEPLPPAAEAQAGIEAQADVANVDNQSDEHVPAQAPTPAAAAEGQTDADSKEARIKKVGDDQAKVDATIAKVDALHSASEAGKQPPPDDQPKEKRAGAT
jgi:type IV secretory pathway VirB6-like protein